MENNIEVIKEKMKEYESLLIKTSELKKEIFEIMYKTKMNELSEVFKTMNQDEKEKWFDAFNNFTYQRSKQIMGPVRNNN